MFVVSQFILKEEWKEVDYSMLVTNLADDAYWFQVRLNSIAYSKPHPYVSSPGQWFKGRWRASVEDKEQEFAFQQVGPSTYASDALIPALPNETIRIDIDIASSWKAEHLRSLTGYAELGIPLIDRGVGSLEPQGGEPVPVLVHASRNLGGSKWSDIPSPMAISSGQALNEITPEQPQTWDLPSWTAVEDIGRDTAEIDESLLPASNTAVFIEAPESLRKVLSYVAYLGKSTTNIDRFNEMLREAGHDLRLTSD